MKTLGKSDATGSLAEYTADIEKKPVIVTSDRIPIAVLVPIGNVDRETMSLSTNAVFIALIERSRARHRVEGGISNDDMRRRMRDGERA
jgi:antitoxin (DNA-binding transcriptional repressor) of toxin-antitoxin stability system